MTVRFHLFPFRTQKLSSLVPKIVRWKRRVKIGSRRLEQKRFRRDPEAFFFCSLPRRMSPGLFCCCPKKLPGFMRVFNSFRIIPEIKGSTANASASSLKTCAYFRSKYLLKSIGGGGGIRIENGAEFSSKQPLSNKKNKEREGKS